MKIERFVEKAATEDEAYGAALDRLVDTKGYSYDEARRELGDAPYEVYEAKKPQPIGRVASRAVVRAPRRRRRSGNGPQYGEEEGVGYPNNEPPYFQPYTPLSDEQRAINRRGVEAARDLLGRLHDIPPKIDE